MSLRLHLQHAIWVGMVFWICCYKEQISTKCKFEKQNESASSQKMETRFQELEPHSAH